LQGDHKNRRGIGIGLGYGRRVAVTWQVTLGAGNFVADIVGRSFQVDRKFEFYRDAALTLLADTRQRADTRNTVDVLFQRLCNLVLNDIGIRSCVRTGNRYNRVVHRWIFTYTDIKITNHSE